MSNQRRIRRKLRGVKGMSKRKLKPVAGGMMSRHQLTELMRPVREVFRNAGEASGMEADQEDGAND